MTEIQRLAAFTTEPQGGNPAGVVLDASALDDSRMLALAADIGYSETAFVTGEDVSSETPHLQVRYFSPAKEVDFCGHATIATAVAWARKNGPGTVIFKTRAGEIPVTVERDADGLRATLTSVPTSLSAPSSAALEEALASLDWNVGELDADLPPKVAFGGVPHLVLAAGSRDRLSRLDYDFDRLRQLMEAEGWITLQLIFRDNAALFHARNPFPVGGVVEDPATGAAAAAFGGYARDLGLIEAGGNFLIVQGEDMGRRSQLYVDIPNTGRRVQVSGHACEISAD